METTQERQVNWLDRPLLTTVTLNWEVLIFTLLVVLFFFTRFYDLGARVMSHDESLHTYYSWQLYKGQGFTHTPLMHGPLQFHLIALSYFLFGDSDFTARIPAVLASIFSIIFLWNYRRYLGRVGTLITAALFVISPYLLYYGRYVRNEAYIVPIGLVTIWSILRYLETGKERYFFFLTAATALHFTVKETAFIYTAQAMLFLAIYFVNRITKRSWDNAGYRNYFLIALIASLVLAGVGFGFFLYGRNQGGLSATETLTPLIPGEDTGLSTLPVPSALTISLLIFSGIAFLISLFYLIKGYTWNKIRSERSFSMLILFFTLTLPMLAAFPVRFMGWDPLDYSSAGQMRTAIFLVPMMVISIIIGLVWNPRLFVISASIFYSIFIIFFTTIFTNGSGFLTGLVGSLGYWLEQQGVRRGSQPFYYYFLIQIPVYEYLAALGSLLAMYLGIRVWWRSREEPETVDGDHEDGEADQTADNLIEEDEASGDEVDDESPAPAILLIGFWTATSLIAYTVAGEKMPWLTVHIVWPMILLTGWALGKLVTTTNWTDLRTKRPFLVIAAMLVFLASLTAVMSSLFGTNRPFGGMELEQLQASVTFVTAALTAIVSGVGLAYLLRSWDWSEIGRVATLTLFSILAVLTARTAFNASYINYDEGTEYLVYAHGARGVKEVMNQVEEISQRTTDGLDLAVAYDDDVAWPMTWYLRNYPNQRYYAKNPTRDLRDVPIILVGDDHFGEIEPIVGQAFDEFNYIRMVWPDQDYFNLTLDRIVGALTNPEMRSAIFQIWLNRNYNPYAEIKGKDMSVSNWNPADRMRMYVRRDVAAKLWNYGVGPSPEEVIADPYEGKQIQLAADKFFGTIGAEPGQFNAPRGVAVAPDGTLYVADSGNNRIQHMSTDGEVLNSWGTFGETNELGEAPDGSFSEPWGITVGPDGSVYVADTWNHRIQKFSPEGEFLAKWGYFGQAEDGYALWGPRGLTIDSLGRLLVTDTGNKRIVIYDESGNYLGEIGFSGFGPGEFNEPTGITIDEQDRVFVADTWNQRVQTFQLNDDDTLTPITAWDVVGWFGQSLNNKPYLTVDASGRIFITDPEGNRVLEFTMDGEFVRFWGDFSTGADGLNLPTGIAADANGGVWVTDAGNNLVLHFTPP